MIHLFRKIRWKTISSNDTVKYILYAVGEILLVIIGILIALQLDNWNEAQKNEEKNIAILSEVQKDIIKDLTRANAVIDEVFMLDSLATLIFNRQLTADDYRTRRTPRNPFQFYIRFVLHNNGYEHLLSNVDNLSLEQKKILSSLHVIYNRLNDNIDISNQRIKETVYRDIDYTGMQRGWFKNVRANEEEIKYKLESDRYLNYASIYMNDAINLFRNAFRYKKFAIPVYDSLQQITKSPIQSAYSLNHPDSVFLATISGKYRAVDFPDAFEKYEKIELKIKNGQLIFVDNDSSTPCFWHSEDIFVTSGYMRLSFYTASHPQSMNLSFRSNNLKYEKIDD